MPLYGRATGDYREYADRASFDVSEITISLWVKWSSSTASVIVAARGSAAGDGQWRYGTNSSGHEIFLVYIGGANRIATTGTAPRIGVWQHVFCTYQQTDGFVRLYRDGDQIASTAYSAAAMAASPTVIRVFQDTGSGHADCTVGWFGLWNTLLPADDRFALYAGNNPATIRPDAQVIVDQFDPRWNVNTADMTVPTDAGNVMSVPRALPWRADYVNPVPGPRNITRRRRGLPSGAPPAQSPLLLRLHNERLFTGGFA